MRTRLGEAEDVGYDFMEQKCGEENHITPFFNGLLQFENQLTAVRVALGDASTMLSCPKINSLYISAVHDSFCTDFAAANANGFILFLLVSMSSMIIVTLRASWRVS